MQLGKIYFASRGRRSVSTCSAQWYGAKTARLFQTPVNHFHVGSIVLKPHMLEHADRNNAIEGALNIAIIFKLEAHRPVWQKHLANLTCSPETVTPDTFTPYCSAANFANPPQPQPISNTRIPDFRSIFRQINSSLASWAWSSVWLPPISAGIIHAFVQHDGKDRCRYRSGVGRLQTPWPCHAFGCNLAFAEAIRSGFDLRPFLSRRAAKIRSKN